MGKKTFIKSPNRPLTTQAEAIGKILRFSHNSMRAT